MSFLSLGIDEEIVAKLAAAGINEPTDIQMQAMPPALNGRDVVGRSPTGTGKTLAYLLPVIAAVDASRRENQALILAPTYELVIQIQRQVELLTAGGEIKSAPLVKISVITQL